MADALGHCITRRRVLQAGAILGATSVVPFARTARSQEPRIVVVGAGLAGMTAAHRIYQQTGVAPAVYEAQDEIGGRTKTIRDLPGGLITERGGTFISTGDNSIRNLINELGLALIDLGHTYLPGRMFFYFDGERRSRNEVLADGAATAGVARRHFAQIKWPATFDHSNERTEHWDHVTVEQWIDRYTPGGLDSIYGRYLSAYISQDYALPLGAASAITIIADFGAPGRSYDERFIVRDGVDSIVKRIRRRLPVRAVTPGAILVALKRNGDRFYTCTFAANGSLNDVIADYVVLALPFSKLREVDYADAGFSVRQDRAIQGLGMGLNTKISLLFERAPWEPKSNGESISDLSCGYTWPGHVGQGGANKILVTFNGPPFAAAYGNAPPHAKASPDVAAAQLAAVDAIYPGTSDAFIDGEAYLDHWPADPWCRGSYSFYPTGGFTGYAGVEARRSGGVHFAGEHTARYGNRGTMNGAVQSGRRAAAEVVADMAQTYSYS